MIDDCVFFDDIKKIYMRRKENEKEKWRKEKYKIEKEMYEKKIID